MSISASPVRVALETMRGYMPTSFRPSLLLVTAGMAGVTAIANAVAIAAPAAEQAPPSRLGNSIQQSVRERDQALAQQKRALQLREQAAKASEERIKAELESRQAEAARPVPAASGGKSLEANEPYDELARIYQTMKPAKAAPIFERLDLDVQTAVARRMRERSTALILSHMNPANAVQLSMALAGKPMPVVKSAKAPPAATPASKDGSARGKRVAERKDQPQSGGAGRAAR